MPIPLSLAQSPRAHKVDKSACSKDITRDSGLVRADQDICADHQGMQYHHVARVQYLKEGAGLSSQNWSVGQAAILDEWICV